MKEYYCSDDNAQFGTENELPETDIPTSENALASNPVEEVVYTPPVSKETVDGISCVQIMLDEDMGTGTKGG